MILHLFPAEKFTTDYINRIYRLFNPEEHMFIVYGRTKTEFRLKDIVNKDRVVFTENIYSIRNKFEYAVKESTVLIFHSLFLNTIDLFIINNILNKYKITSEWDIWGKDLYEDYDKCQSLKSLLLVKPYVKEQIRKSLISKMDIFITTGDYDVLKQRYKLKTSAQAMGAQYTYKLLNCVELKENKKFKVMVGHSATITCRHIETFEMLSKYAGSIEVYCPLSYPNDQEYIDNVLQYGKRIFGIDFHGITKFMGYEEYVDFLNTIDIGVFNNSRQQGMGNITNLLYLGKKVYLSLDNTIRKSYYRPEYNIFNIDEIGNDDFLIPLSAEQKIRNKQKIQYKFSDENFYKEWRRVFDA